MTIVIDTVVDLVIAWSWASATHKLGAPDWATAALFYGTFALLWSTDRVVRAVKGGKLS